MYPPFPPTKKPYLYKTPWFSLIKLFLVRGEVIEVEKSVLRIRLALSRAEHKHAKGTSARDTREVLGFAATAHEKETVVQTAALPL